MPPPAIKIFTRVLCSRTSKQILCYTTPSDISMPPGLAAQNTAKSPPMQSPLKIAYVAGCPRSGSTLINRVLGAHPDAITLGSIKKLLPMLAPVVMGMLAKKRGGGADLGSLLGGGGSNGIDLGDITGLLGGGTGSGGVMGMLKGSSKEPRM